ncbi:hypothetical protein [Microbispora bryophytorum]|uniref:Uncharacterized protein n=1 Tax=Microbispora bryophytorum subsp. camponoti TaxID=1677852 RepID=A0ABR8L5Q9_9ACTN|nr:hypothetical protein [Microbispora camponoti]MBD3144780.1 hypothetical protein [Microbispora camponoti]
MDRFVKELEHARGVIGERAEAVRRVFAARGLPAASLSPIGEVERWIDERLPDLRRRHRMAVGLSHAPSWSPGSLVPYDEKNLLGAAEARRLGGALAAAYKDVDPDAPFDFHLVDKYRKLVEDLAAHADDSEFAAAFFAGIGARRTVELPRRLRQVLQENVDEAVRTVSRAFGAAMSAGSAVPGFEAVGAAVRARADDEEDRRDIGELLSAGRLPTEWLAEVVVTQVFLPGEKTRGETLAPYLEALAADPAAARIAIALATRNSPLPKDAAARLLTRPGLGPRDRRPDLVPFLRDLNDRAAVDATSADAFGRMLAAASGAYDEKDGAHSDVAARFAFAVVTGASGFGFAPPTRVHLAEIAGAYATEITEGANLGDSNQLLPSAFGPVESHVPGLSPMFRLSPEDTYRFLLTFAGDESDRRPFDQGMGDLARRLVGVNVAPMLKTADPTRLDDLFAALGNVRGFELAAAEKHLKALDDVAERNDLADDMAWDVSQLVLGKALPQGELLWLMLDQSRGLLKDSGPGEETNVERLRDSDNDETLGRQHTVALLLLGAGFPAAVSPKDYQATCPPGVAIADDEGNLRPFPAIAQSGNQGLRALDRWFIANGLDGNDQLSLGKSSRRWADRFDGNKQRAQARAKLLGG